jgi:hypothetical protein
MRGVSSSGFVPTQEKHSKGQKSSELERHRKDESKTGDKRRCHGCNRVDHDRDTCRMTDHPDFVTTGLWAGSATERAIRLWKRDESKIQLPWTRRADGTPLITPLVWQTQHTTARPPTPPRAYPPPDRDAGRGRGGRDNDRRNDRRGRGGHGTVHFDTKDKGTPLSCNCGGTDINSTYRQCLVSTRPSTTFFTALTLFNTGAYTSFVNREVAKWLEQRQRADTLEAVFSAHSSKFDIPTASVGHAGTQLTSSINGTVVFDLTLFNEVTQSDDILTNIRASVIDSCIEVIIGLPESPDPNYFELNANMDDTTSTVRAATRPLSLIRPAVMSTATNVAVCRGASPCKMCVDLIAMGYDSTLYSLAGRPHTPRPREIRDHPPISEAELVKKRDIFDPLEDDDDIDWKHNPFDVDFIDDERESPEQLMSKITFKGSPQLQTRLLALVREFIDVFATKVRREPVAVEPMNIIDKDKWRLPCNRQPPRRHSEEKQKEIRKQVDALLKLGIIKESKATEWSQVHLVPKPTPDGAPQKRLFTLDFVRLNAATGALEGWPIPNIQ